MMLETFQSSNSMKFSLESDGNGENFQSNSSFSRLVPARPMQREKVDSNGGYDGDDEDDENDEAVLPALPFSILKWEFITWSSPFLYIPFPVPLFPLVDENFWQEGRKVVLKNKFIQLLFGKY